MNFQGFKNVYGKDAKYTFQPLGNIIHVTANPQKGMRDVSEQMRDGKTDMVRTHGENG